MLDSLVIAILAYGHILSAVGWLGSAIFTVFILLPSLGRLSPPTSAEFTVKIVPRIVRFVAMISIATVLFGVALLYVSVGGDFALMAPTSTWGAAMTTGITLALIAFVLGLVVTLPTFGRLVSIVKSMSEKGEEPPPELGRYIARSRMLGVLNVVLLLMALAAMVTAGYY